MKMKTETEKQVGHTPGPWKHFRDHHANTPINSFSVMAVEGVICELNAEPENREGDLERQEANARLIAAAPELLEALERIAEHSSSEITQMVAKAAITKAKGDK